MWYGILFTLMMIWGLNVVALKILVEHFPPVTMQSLRVFTAGIVLSIFMIMSKSFSRLTKKELSITLIAGVFGVFGHHFFIALGLSRTTASNAGLILALVPLTTSLLAIIFLNNKLTMFRFIGIILGLIGVTFIVLKGNSNLGTISIGDLYILGAVLTQAISFIIIKKGTETIDSRLLTSIMMVFGSTILFVVSLFLEPNRISEIFTIGYPYWILFFASAIIATGLGHMTYNSAISKLGAGETSIFINLTPFFSLTSSALFLGELIKVTQIFGFILIIIGVILGTGLFETFVLKEKIVRANTPS